MNFLIHIKVFLPEQIEAKEVEKLYREEAVVARLLASQGVITRLWKNIEDQSTWGICASQNKRALIKRLDALPLRKYMDIEIMTLSGHPNDPQFSLLYAPAISEKIPETMMAIIKKSDADSSISLVEKKLPRPRPNQVLIEVFAASVCGTDLHIIAGHYPSSPPVVMGHEVAGRVVAIGGEVDAKWLGERVACETHHQVCDCYYCRIGKRNLCPNKVSIGSIIDGGFAEYITVAQELLHRVPDRVSDHASALTEPLACVAHCLFDPPIVNSGDQVLVVGSGPIGVLAAQIARAAGAVVTIVGLEQDKKRLEIAISLGFNAGTKSEVDAYDVVIECSGSEGGVKTALSGVIRGGKYVSIGICGQEITIPFDQILYKELELTSGFASTPESWLRAEKLLNSGLVDLDCLVSSVLPLRSWPLALGPDRSLSDMKTVFNPKITL
jgi:L-iditol 2-dehydrogenase